MRYLVCIILLFLPQISVANNTVIDGKNIPAPTYIQTAFQTELYPRSAESCGAGIQILAMPDSDKGLIVITCECPFSTKKQYAMTIEGHRLFTFPMVTTGDKYSIQCEIPKDQIPEILQSIYSRQTIQIVLNSDTGYPKMWLIENM